MELLVAPCGMARCIYDEVLPLTSLGTLAILRASHVEPTVNGRWTADLSPVDGPILGPFACRSEALASEVAWIKDRWLV